MTPGGRAGTRGTRTRRAMGDDYESVASQRGWEVRNRPQVVVAFRGQGGCRQWGVVVVAPVADASGGL